MGTLLILTNQRDKKRKPMLAGLCPECLDSVIDQIQPPTPNWGLHS